MPLLEGKTPAERNKTIAALALGALALLFLARMFLGGPSTPTRNTNTAGIRRTTTTTTTVSNSAQSAALEGDSIELPQPVDYQFIPVDASEPGRNIFAFYEPPVRKQPDAVAINIPTPVPAPPPPWTLNGVAPSNVFAQTEAFTLTLAGDKFTPQARVYVDSQEVPTTFTSAQQLAAQIPATLIGAPGTRQIVVHTPDGALYSNPVALSVAEPPKPLFTYIGLLGTVHYGNDKAMLKLPTSGVIAVQRGNQALQFTDVAAVQRGDIIGGRFRVTSISERSVDFMDTQLRIKHTLPYVDAHTGTSGRPYTPPPPSADDDNDEPQQ